MGDSDYSTSSLGSYERVAFDQFENVRFTLLCVHKNTPVCDCRKEQQLSCKCTYFETNPVTFGHSEQPIGMWNLISFSMAFYFESWQQCLLSGRQFLTTDPCVLWKGLYIWMGGQRGGITNWCVSCQSLAPFGRGPVNYNLWQVLFGHSFEPSRGSPL